MSDRWGHTWRTYDREPYCAGCGVEPGERGAAEPCPNADRPLQNTQAWIEAATDMIDLLVAQSSKDDAPEEWVSQQTPQGQAVLQRWAEFTPLGRGPGR